MLAPRPPMAAGTKPVPRNCRKFPVDKAFSMASRPGGAGMTQGLAEAVATANEARAGHARPLRVAHVAEAFGGGLLEGVRVIAEHAAAEGCDVLVVHGR